MARLDENARHNLRNAMAEGSLINDARVTYEDTEKVANALEQRWGELADSPGIGSIGREAIKEPTSEFRQQLLEAATEAFSHSEAEAFTAFHERAAALPILRRNPRDS